MNRSQALDEILSGIKEAANFITQTMGPGGKLVGFASSDEFKKFRLTKDGANASKLIKNIGGPVKNIGASLVVESSQKMVKIVGDGTTTVAAIFEALATSCYNLIKAEYNINLIKEALREMPEFLAQEINKIKKSIDYKNEDVKTVAHVASNGDLSISSKLSELITKLGKDFVILVEEAKTEEDNIILKNGFFFDKGATSTYFFSKHEEQTKMKIHLEDAFVLIIGEKLSNIRSIAGLINEIAPSGKPMLIVADDFDEDIQGIFIANKLKMNLSYICVKAPLFGDKKTAFLEDLAIITDTKVLNLSQMSEEECGAMKSNILGKAKKIIISRDTTTIIDGHGLKEEKEKRIEIVRSALENSVSTYDTEKIQERLARLQNGVGIFQVGGKTEIEINEKKERVEDAIHACKNAIIGGIVPGAGSEFLWVSHQSSKIKKSEHSHILQLLIKNSFSVITRKIIQNTEKLSPDVVINEIQNHINEGKHNFGFNGVTGKIEALDGSVINPARVSIEAIKIACSFCEKFVDLGSIIYETETEKKMAAIDPMTMMGH